MGVRLKWWNIFFWFDFVDFFYYLCLVWIYYGDNFIMSYYLVIGKMYDNNDGMDGIYRVMRFLLFVVDILELLFILREKFCGL